MKLKICGVQSAAEAKQLAYMGVDFVGLNFVPTSLRCIDIETARETAESLKNTSLKIVALFQDQSLDLVLDYARYIKPNYIQLHGNETADFIASIDIPIIKLVTTLGESEMPRAKYYLLDREVRGRGPVFDPDIAAAMVASHPGKIFLAGGLTPDNLTETLARVQPFAVDIAGGVSTDDVIDFDKVKKVLEIVRGSHDT